MFCAQLQLQVAEESTVISKISLYLIHYKHGVISLHVMFYCMLLFVYTGVAGDYFLCVHAMTCKLNKDTTTIELTRFPLLATLAED